MASQDWKLIKTDYVFDDRGELRVTQEFRIWGYSAASVESSPEQVRNAQGEPLPAAGTFIGAAKLRAYTASETQENIYVTAVAEFSTRSSSLLPPKPIAERPGYGAQNGSTWMGALLVPIAVKETSVKGTEVSVQWTRKVFSQRMGFQRRQHRVVRANLSDPEKDRIAAQTGNLHLFSKGGQPAYYQFEGGRYQETDSGEWTIVYEWTREDGLPFFAFGFDNQWSDGTDTVFRIPPVTADDIRANLPDWQEEGVWAVPPYHRPELGIDASEPELDSQPRYVHMFTSNIDNTGWRSLPGLGQ